MGIFNSTKGDQWLTTDTGEQPTIADALVEEQAFETSKQPNVLQQLAAADIDPEPMFVGGTVVEPGEPLPLAILRDRHQREMAAYLRDVAKLDHYSKAVADGQARIDDLNAGIQRLLSRE